MGLSLTETAIIYGLLPFFSCLGPLLSGYMADKLGNYKAVLVVFNFFSIVLHMILGFAIPSALQRTEIVPFQDVQFNVTFRCTDTSSLFATEPSVMDRQCIANTTLFNYVFAPEYQLVSCRCLADEVVPSNDYAELKTSNGSEVLHLLTNKIVSSDYCRPLFSANCSAEIRSCQVLARLSGLCGVIAPSANHLVTFALYFTVRMLAGMFGSTLMPLLDAAAYTMAEEHGGEIRQNRVSDLYLYFENRNFLTGTRYLAMNKTLF